MDNENEQNRELEYFFSELTERFDLVSVYEAKIARFEAPRFNVFDYIEPNENKVTAILSDLLDPNGRHCQGRVFLESFLRRIGFIKPSKEAITRAVIRTEDQTPWKRRLDLTIWMNECFLGLENKIDAAEQTGQVGDYLGFLRSCTKGDWFFVFLTKDGRDPKECSEEQWKDARDHRKAISLSYADLSAWLHSCVALSLSERVRALVLDMANWAEKLRGGKLTTDFTPKVILDFVTRKNDPNLLAILLKIQDCSESVRKELIAGFGRVLEQTITAEYDDWDIKSSMSGALDRSPGILLRRRSWPEGCRIGIAADKLESPFGFGLEWLNADAKIKAELQNALRKKLGIGKKPTDLWPWYADIPDFGSVEVKSWTRSDTIKAMHRERDQVIRHYIDKGIKEVEDVVGPILERA